MVIPAGEGLHEVDILRYTVKFRGGGALVWNTIVFTVSPVGDRP